MSDRSSVKEEVDPPPANYTMDKNVEIPLRLRLEWGREIHCVFLARYLGSPQKREQWAIDYSHRRYLLLGR